MAALTPHAMTALIVKTQKRFYELDHLDWDDRHRRYRTPEQDKWEQAARETAPPDWAEFVRILAQGWSYYGGSDLPTDGRA